MTRDALALPDSLPLSHEDRQRLTDLYVAGTPEATLRAWERDLVYITAWRLAAFGAAPVWPERADVALRFLLDHSRDLSAAPASDGARMVAEMLVARGLRRGYGCPAPATLDRRVASWRSFHRMRDQDSPFDLPALKSARAAARRATARPKVPKSANPITRDLLERLEAACGNDLAGIRDRAILLTGWASGGRRRSELVALDVGDVDMGRFEAEGVLRLSLWTTKTTRGGETPALILTGRAARVLVAWIDAAGLSEGPLFRRVTRTGAVGRRRLSAAAVGQIVKRRLTDAGLPRTHASAHGLRSGFLTQAALDGAPLAAAMRLSLHRSAAQAQAYYADADLARNPAARLLDRPAAPPPDPSSGRAPVRRTGSDRLQAAAEDGSPGDRTLEETAPADMAPGEPAPGGTDGSGGGFHKDRPR